MPARSARARSRPVAAARRSAPRAQIRRRDSPVPAGRDSRDIRAAGPPRGRAHGRAPASARHAARVRHRDHGADIHRSAAGKRVHRRSAADRPARPRSGETNPAARARPVPRRYRDPASPRGRIDHKRLRRRAIARPLPSTTPASSPPPMKEVCRSFPFVPRACNQGQSVSRPVMFACTLPALGSEHAFTPKPVPTFGRHAAYPSTMGHERDMKMAIAWRCRCWNQSKPSARRCLAGSFDATSLWLSRR